MRRTGTMLKLLGRKDSVNVQKVLWVLTELELDYVREDYGGTFGGNNDAEYLGLNPNGLVPTLVDQDAVLWESNTICRYLANRYGPTDLYPADPAKRARCERWMDWQLGTLSGVMVPLFWGIVRTPIDQRDLAALESLRGRASNLFAILDRAMHDHPYLGGTDFTIADIPCGIWLYRWRELGFNEASMTRLEDWYGRLSAREGFRRHVAIGLT